MAHPGSPPPKNALIRFFARRPDATRLEDREEVDRQYRRFRRPVVVALTLSYAFSYTCRLGLGVVKKPLIDLGIYTPQNLGWIGAAFLWGYGAGKLFNGFIADRVRARAFIATGLGASAVINLVMGSQTLALVAIVLWAVNGWVQGVGAPSSVVAITQWFTSKERGTIYGIWSTAHSLGEGMTYFGTATLVSLTVWRAAFWVPGVICFGVAFAVYFAIRERPETIGLPPVAEWKCDSTADAAAEAATKRTATEAQLALLKRPAVWVLGIASALMYVTRYAVNNWGVLYLQEARGFSLPQAGGLIGLNTIAGVGGSAAYGAISDRFFDSRRPPPTLLFGLVEIVGLMILFYGPAENTWLLGLGMVLYGFTLSGILAVLGGLFAVDIAHNEAAGAAMGLVGVFSYLGAGAQELLSGALIARGTTIVDNVRHYDFSLPVKVWIGSSLLSMLLAATLWRVRATD